MVMIYTVVVVAVVDGWRAPFGVWSDEVPPSNKTVAGGEPLDEKVNERNTLKRVNPRRNKLTAGLFSEVLGALLELAKSSC